MIQTNVLSRYVSLDLFTELDLREHLIWILDELHFTGCVIHDVETTFIIHISPCVLMGRTNVFDVTDLVLVVEVSGTNRIELGKQGRIIPVLRHLHLIKLEILQFKMTKYDSGSGSFNPAIGFLTVVIMNPWDIEIHPHL